MYRQGDMKLIWGHPGYSDGYGLELMRYWLHNDYLAFINQSNSNSYDSDISYNMGIQECKHAIVKAIGIEGMRRTDKDRGMVMLFNITGKVKIGSWRSKISI